jgi:uncharacterized protein (TIGR02271 family)
MGWHGRCVREPLERDTAEECWGRRMGERADQPRHDADPGSTSVDSAKAGIAESDGQVVERVEERLAPNIEVERAGSLRLRRSTVEDLETVEVPLRHHELLVERHPVDRPMERDEQPVSERGDATVILVVEERLEVRRVPWVVEEVRVRRRLVTEQRQVTDTVRRERIDIDTEGEMALSDS